MLQGQLRGDMSVELDRRSLLAALSVSAVAPRALAKPLAPPLFIATYQNEGGRGVAPLQLTTGVVGPYRPILDASYGVYSARHRLRYLVREADPGALTAYGEDWTVRGGVATGGAAPCFVALDPDQAFLAVANYNGGSVALVRLDPADGRPLDPAQVVAHRGSGPDRSRQAGPHAHWVGFSPDRRWLHSVDLGADAVFAHPFDPVRGEIGEGEIAYAAPTGSGPRHLVRHPTLQRAYLVSELANTLTVLETGADGRFVALQTLSTLPAGFSAHSQAAHIAIDRAARTLYVSNRGADTLAVFALDALGRPSLQQQISCGGRWPRFFLLIEEAGKMLVANERSGEIAVFDRTGGGRLRDTGRRIAAPGVVFIMG